MISQNGCVELTSQLQSAWHSRRDSCYYRVSGILKVGPDLGRKGRPEVGSPIPKPRQHLRLQDHRSGSPVWSSVKPCNSPECPSMGLFFQNRRFCRQLKAQGFGSTTTFNRHAFSSPCTSIRRRYVLLIHNCPSIAPGCFAATPKGDILTVFP